MAVRPVPSIPLVTSSAVEKAENSDGPFLLNNHSFIVFLFLQQYVKTCTMLQVQASQSLCRGWQFIETDRQLKLFLKAETLEVYLIDASAGHFSLANVQGSKLAIGIHYCH